MPAFKGKCAVVPSKGQKSVLVSWDRIICCTELVTKKKTLSVAILKEASANK